MNVLKVSFDEDLVGSRKIPPEVKAKYLDSIKNEWNYPSITNFVNTIAEGIVNHNMLIIKVDSSIIDKLLKRVKEKNYDGIEDWFKEQIRKELSQ